MPLIYMKILLISASSPSINDLLTINIQMESQKRGKRTKNKRLTAEQGGPYLQMLRQKRRESIPTYTKVEQGS